MKGVTDMVIKETDKNIWKKFSSMIPSSRQNKGKFTNLA